MTTIKQLLQITSGGEIIFTDLGNDFHGEFDYDELCGSLTFNLPYDSIAEGSANDGTEIVTNFKTLKKNDRVQLYYKEFTEDPGTVTPASLDLVFDGYINKITLEKSKGDYPYNFECLGLLGWSSKRSVSKFNEAIGGVEAFKIMLQRAGLQKDAQGNGADIIPANKIIDHFQTDEEKLLIKWSGGKSLKDCFDSVRERYGVKIHYQGNGYLHIFEPMSFFSTTSNVDIEVWNFKLGDNVFKVNYGELNKKYNTVVVHYGPPGMEAVAIAIDPTSFSENTEINGLESSDINNNDVVMNFNFSIKHLHRRDIEYYSDAVKVAKNELLELLKQYVLTIQVPFKSDYKTTDFFVFDDGDIYKDAFFMIKKYSFDISKSNVSCKLTGIASMLGEIPESFITDNDGLTDIHVLDIEKEISDATGWNVFSV